MTEAPSHPSSPKSSAIVWISPNALCKGFVPREVLLGGGGTQWVTEGVPWEEDSGTPASPLFSLRDHEEASGFAPLWVPAIAIQIPTRGLKAVCPPVRDWGLQSPEPEQTLLFRGWLSVFSNGKLTNSGHSLIFCSL